MQRTLFLSKLTSLLLSLSLLFCCAGAISAGQQPLLQSPQGPYRTSITACPDHSYTVKIFSKDPLVIYITDFITTEEAEHLQRITQHKFTKSGVVDESGVRLSNATTRTSSSTSLERDEIIRCIEERALTFQGYLLPRTHLEPLQLVHYTLGEEYRPHTDWFESPLHTTADLGGNRLTSFFVYVAVSSDITGGGTNFPLLDAPTTGIDDYWCQLINCDEPWDDGVTFRPIARNAVFWQNLNLKDGSGDPRTLHAGLPLTSGTKLGMNIWTRQGPLSEKFRGED